MSGSRDVTPGTVALTDPAAFTGPAPHDRFARLRREDPVHPTTLPDGRRHWMITRHGESVEVLRSARRFSAEHGMTLDSVRPDRDPAAGLMLELTDPPGHARLRRLLHDFFRPATAHQMQPQIEAAVDRVLAVAPGEVVDVATAIASPLAGDVMAVLTGIDAEQVTWVVDRAARAFEEVGPTRGTALPELFAFFGQEIRRRVMSNDPPLDVVAALLASDADGRREAVANVVNVVAGAATIRNAISGALVALAQAPDQWQILRSDPDVVPSAVEELVRFASPAIHVARTASAPTVLGDRRVDAGDVVTVWLISANRDEAVFDEPDRLLLDRDPNPHLAFATGAHACIGTHIARMTLAALLRRAAAGFSHLEPIDEPRYLASTFVRSVTSFPVRFVGPRP